MKVSKAWVACLATAALAALCALTPVPAHAGHWAGPYWHVTTGRHTSDTGSGGVSLDTTSNNWEGSDNTGYAVNIPDIQEISANANPTAANCSLYVYPIAYYYWVDTAGDTPPVVGNGSSWVKMTTIGYVKDTNGNPFSSSGVTESIIDFTYGPGSGSSNIGDSGQIAYWDKTATNTTAANVQYGPFPPHANQSGNPGPSGNCYWMTMDVGTMQGSIGIVTSPGCNCTVDANGTFQFLNDTSPGKYYKAIYTINDLPAGYSTQITLNSGDDASSTSALTSNVAYTLTNNTGGTNLSMSVSGGVLTLTRDPADTTTGTVEVVATYTDTDGTTESDTVTITIS
jgi:hypothetical protein